MKNQIYPCLWFDGQAQEAAKFYKSLFKNSKSLESNSMVSTFEIEGLKVMALKSFMVVLRTWSISIVTLLLRSFGTLLFRHLILFLKQMLRRKSRSKLMKFLPSMDWHWRILWYLKGTFDGIAYLVSSSNWKVGVQRICRILVKTSVNGKSTKNSYLKLKPVSIGVTEHA